MYSNERKVISVKQSEINVQKWLSDNLNKHFKACANKNRFSAENLL